MSGPDVPDAHHLLTGHGSKGRMKAQAGVAEPVDARDLKSCARSRACGFEPRLRHHEIPQGLRVLESTSRCLG